MKAISTHSMDHIRVHLVCEEVKVVLLRTIRAFSEKVRGSTDKIVALAVILLVASLIVFAFMTLGEFGTVVANYCDVCDLIPSMIVTP